MIGSFVYMPWLSVPVFVLALAATLPGVALNVYAKRGWMRDYEGVRDTQDDLQKQYRAITEGAKELRLRSDRRDRVHTVRLSGAADRIAEPKIRAMRLFWTADPLSAAIFFVVTGLPLAV